MLWQIKDATYAEVVDKLRHRFGTQEQQEKFRLELRTRRRGRNEKIQELSQDIENLVVLAFPEAGSETRDVLAREAFIEALGEPALSYKIREKGPYTLHESVMMAMKLEVLRDSRIQNRDNFRPRQVRKTQAEQEKDLTKAQHVKLADQGSRSQAAQENEALQRKVNSMTKK